MVFLSKNSIKEPYFDDFKKKIKVFDIFI